MTASAGAVVSTLDAKLRALRAWCAARGSLLVGFSGGIDSAFLAVTATDAIGGDNVLAVLGVSASLSTELHERAHMLAATFGVRFREITTRELDDANYVANRGDRCFHCKRELWDRLASLARAEGLATVVDGTIADDFAEHRPGAAAGARAGVESPLAKCGFTKADVRAAAHARGLPNWNAPAAPCLASRLATGVNVTRERLARVERAESALRALGIAGDLRVRDLGDGARIELPAAALPRWLAPEAVARLRDAVGGAGFTRVFLDRAGYRRGALQSDTPAAIIDITNAANDTIAPAQA